MALDPAIRLLIVDDDRALCDLLTEFLQPLGFQVDCAHDFQTGLARAMQGRHEIAVLDVMLPGGNGFDLLRTIRAKSALPVLMLTARGEDVDRIVGLQIGADDYLPKPFNSHELAARLQAIMRRARPNAQTAALVTVDDVEVEPAARIVRCNGKAIELTGTEFLLLEVLLSSAGTVVSRDELCRRVLGRAAQSYDRSIDMHVSHVRRKLGPSADGGDRIRSIRGEGYIYLRRSRGRAADAAPNNQGAS